jgi:hypothetical protein
MIGFQIFGLHMLMLHLKKSTNRDNLLQTTIDIVIFDNTSDETKIVDDQKKL